jgi:ATP-binding cassette subfamily C (CFTR/MRP) protein 1
MLTPFRILDLHHGAIITDDDAIAEFARQDVHVRLNAIPQEPFFLKDTVRMNLDLYQTSSDEELVMALSKVQLWMWRVWENNGRLRAEMEEDSLWHGQRQLFRVP